MGYEDQYKQAILNMTHNRGGGITLSTFITSSVQDGFLNFVREKKKVLYCMLCFICELRAVLNPIIGRGLSRADYNMSR